MADKKTTIAELEALISDPDATVEVLPDGRVVSIGGSHSDDRSVILTFREEFGGDY